jgi:hypothetical protein
MCHLATYNTRFWWKSSVLCRAHEWEALLHYVEELAAANPQLRALAAELHPEVWLNRRHLPFPLHRLYPAELLDLLERAGFEAPDLNVAES